MNTKSTSYCTPSLFNLTENNKKYTNSNISVKVVYLEYFTPYIVLEK